MEVAIHNALLDKSLDLVNIGIDGGKIVEITKDDLPPGDMDIDAQQELVTPPFFEPHFHLDNPFLTETENQSGSLPEAIEIYARVKESRDASSLIEHAVAAVRESLAYGVLWFRTHVDIDETAQLRGLQGLVSVKEMFADIVDISIIAFPQLGIVRQPNEVEWMYAAMENGADIVGGAPHFEKDMEDAKRQIDIAFEIAKKYNAPIDMHIDETDDPSWQSLELLADKTIEENYQGKVTASHCVAMGGWDETTFERIVAKVKAAEINITTNVLTNLLLQGRHSKEPIRRAIPRIADLMEAGVNVACGHDDMKNMFYPFGNMNPLHSANAAAHAGQLTTPFLIRQAFEMTSYHAAKTFGIHDYGIEVGNTANLLLLPVHSAVDAIRLQPAPSLVMRAGKCLARTLAQRTFHEDVP